MPGMDTRILSNVERLLESVGVGLWTWDSARNRFELDATCRAFLNLGDDEEWSAETAASRVPPEDLERYGKAIMGSLETGSFSVEFRIRRDDGSTSYISGRGHVLPHAPADMPIVKGVFIDVTSKRELKNQLRLQRSRMQELVDGIPGLFSYIDRDYRICFLSSQYRDIFERDEADLIGKHISELLGEKVFAERKQRYDRALAGKVVHHEASRTLPDGREVCFTVTHKPHRDESGEIVGVTSLAMDITDRQLIQRKLEQRGRELERSNKDLEQFAYVASHDLKAPLRAVEVLVEWLRDDLADYEEGEVQENLGLLRQRTARLNTLLDDLLAYSRAGRKVGIVTDVDSRELVQDIVTLLGPPAGMTVEADQSLPQLGANRAPLEQVLRNLINNAIKHHPSPESGHIRVYATDQGDTVTFSVEDDGAGIPEQYANKVFQMFQTLQPRDDREGSGMGLAIVNRIVEWQGGRIWFRPGSGGKGTVFKFTWIRQKPCTTHCKEESHGHEVDTNEACSHLAG